MTEPSMKDVVMMQRIIMAGVIVLVLVMATIVIKFTWPWAWLTWNNVIGGGFLLFIVSVIGFPLYVACRKGILRTKF